MGVLAADVNDVSTWGELAVFELMDRIPLRDLVNLGKTCRRLNVLSKENCRQKVRRTISLVIGQGSHVSQCGFNSITVKQLDRDTCDRFLMLLSNTTGLEIRVINNSSASETIEEIAYLLDALSDRLEYLDVFSVRIEPHFPAQRFFEAINGLVQLKKFKFDYRGYLLETEEADFDLPIISQLETFDFYSCDDGEWLILELMAHSTADKPAHVKCASEFRQIESINLLLDVEPELAARFDPFLKILWPQINANEFTTICDKFSQISQLYLRSNYLTIRQMSHTMAGLSKLTSFYWLVDFRTRSLWRQDPRAFNFFNQEVEPDTVDKTQLVSLPNVTTLWLNLHLVTHSDLAMLHLATVFPNLHTLSIEELSCETCGYASGCLDFELMHRCLQQLQHTATFWRMFPKLSTIKYRWLENRGNMSWFEFFSSFITGAFTGALIGGLTVISKKENSAHREAFSKFCASFVKKTTDLVPVIINNCPLFEWLLNGAERRLRQNGGFEF